MSAAPADAAAAPPPAPAPAAPAGGGDVDLSDMPEGLSKMEQMKVRLSLTLAAVFALCAPLRTVPACAVEARGKVKSRDRELETSLESKHATACITLRLCHVALRCALLRQP